MEIEQRVMFVSLTLCNWQFICSVLSLWTSCTHACIFISEATQFTEQEVWTKVNERLNPLTIHHYACRGYSGNACIRVHTFYNVCVHRQLLSCEWGCREFRPSLHFTCSFGTSFSPGALSITPLPPPFCPKESTTWLGPGRSQTPLSHCH